MTDSETVGFAWWHPANGGSQQAYVGNYNGLDAAGFEVRGYTSDSLAAMIEQTPDFDWCFVPFVFSPEVVGALAERTHVHLQVGGYGANDWEKAKQSIGAADSVSVLDPQLAEPFGLEDAPWIPNPPNVAMFDAGYRPDREGEYVLIPKLHESGTLGPARSVVEEHPETEFIVCGHPEGTVPSNVRVRPKVPLSWMPEVYADATAVLNPVEREGLPNVAYEAFITGTPFVPLRSGGIGYTQTVGTPPLDSVGNPCRAIPANAPGQHFVRYFPEATPAVGKAGREWIDAWNGWGWREKFQAVREIVEL